MLKTTADRPQPLRVLVVEHDPEALALIRRHLTDGGGFDVDCTGDVEDGLVALRLGHYDALVSDSRLKAGLARLTRERMRQSTPPASKTAVIVISDGVDDVEPEPLADGAVEYLNRDELTSSTLRRTLRYAVAARQMSASLEQHERTLQLVSAVVEASRDAIFSRALDGRILSWNTGAVRLFGYEAEEIIGQSARRLLVRDALVPLDAVEAHSPDLSEVDCIRKDGTTFPALRTVSPVRDERGAVVALSCVLHDLTERHQFQHALRETEAEYRATFDQAPVGIAHIGLDGRWVRLNTRLRALLGYDESELRQLHFEAIAHPDDIDAGRTAAQELLAGRRERYDAERRYRRKDGSYIPVRISVSLRRDALEAPKHFIVLVEDVREQTAARQEVEHLFNLSPDMIAVCNFHGRLTRANPAWLRALNYTQEEVIGQPFLRLVHPDDQEMTRNALRSIGLAEARPLELTNRLRRGDGEYRWIEWTAKADPTLQIIYAVGRDQTERRILEQQLVQAQKMEAVGRLAGGIAHDFNNVLTAILGFAEMAAERVGAGHEAYTDIQETVGAARSAAALTSQLLAFSRQQITQHQIQDLNQVVTDVLALVGRVIGEDVVVRTALDPAPCLVDVDKSLMEQVILNLAVNARDAMPGGGTLRIETRALTAAQAAQRTWIELRIADTGTGMPPSVLAQAFEPFFTTKPPGKGTGLGLAMVYGVVKKAGGTVDLRSEVGAGTEFIIRLPRADQAAASESVITSEEMPRGRETLMLVEDQLEVRTIVRRTLEKAGYNVIETQSSAAALALLTAGQPADLVISDLVMPGMNGSQLRAAVERVRPGQAFMFMTGYADETVAASGLPTGRSEILRKPFTRAQLLSAVRRVLDGAWPARKNEGQSAIDGARKWSVSE